MTANLDNLPPEIILILIESGNLNVQEGLALRQVRSSLNLTNYILTESGNEPEDMQGIT